MSSSNKVLVRDLDGCFGKVKCLNKQMRIVGEDWLLTAFALV